MDLPWPPGRPVGRSPKTYLRQGKGYGKESGNTTRRGSSGRHAPEKGKPPQGGGFRKWRRGRDLNPRYPLRYTPLAGARLRPARPPLQGVAHRAKALRGTFACSPAPGKARAGTLWICSNMPPCQGHSSRKGGGAPARARRAGDSAPVAERRSNRPRSPGPGRGKTPLPPRGRSACPVGGRPVSGGPTRGRARVPKRLPARGSATKGRETAQCSRTLRPRWAAAQKCPPDK